MTNSIAYIGGFIGTNIGNAFYDEGILYALKKYLPNNQIHYISDQPENYWLKKHENSNNKFDYLSKINVDYAVIAGPLFTESFQSLWMNTLQKLQLKRTKIVFLSSGFSKYSDTEVITTIEALKSIKPYAICTRDRFTFDIKKLYTIFWIKTIVKMDALKSLL